MIRQMPNGNELRGWGEEGRGIRGLGEFGSEGRGTGGSCSNRIQFCFAIRKEHDFKLPEKRI